MKKERREARNLIFLLSSASFIAFLAVVGLVYYFGSSGTYLLRNVLISPETLEKSSFMDIQFTQVEKQGNGWGRYPVTLQRYKMFYKLVSAERSVPVLTDEMIAQFNLITPSNLTIFIEPQDNTSAFREEKIFQQVQFIDGGELFRVQFHPSHSVKESVEEWIYFRYPGVYEEVVALFAPLVKR